MAWVTLGGGQRWVLPPTPAPKGSRPPPTGAKARRRRWGEEIPLIPAEVGRGGVPAPSPTPQSPPQACARVLCVYARGRACESHVQSARATPPCPVPFPPPRVHVCTRMCVQGGGGCVCANTRGSPAGVCVCTPPTPPATRVQACTPTHGGRAQRGRMAPIPGRGGGQRGGCGGGVVALGTPQSWQ